MDDRTMLELAARASGMQVIAEGKEWPRENVGWFFNQVGSNPPALYNSSSRALDMWSPLDDDGDSRRLQVRLQITLSIDDTRCFATWWVRPDLSRQDSVVELIHSDACAAARLAVLRAAAEIGKTKQEG